VVRPEGFEPPAYCSVADTPDRGERWVWCCDGTDGECLCTCHAESDVLDLDHLLELNRQCPVCGAPLVWGVCSHPHADDLALAA
jgi:hypothetical protein